MEMRCYLWTQGRFFNCSPLKKCQTLQTLFRWDLLCNLTLLGEEQLKKTTLYDIHRLRINIDAEYLKNAQSISGFGSSKFQIKFQLFPCVLKRLSFGKCFLTTIGNHKKSEPVESTGSRESQISSFRADLNSNFQKILSWFPYWNEISLIWNLIAYFWIFTTFFISLLTSSSL